MTKIERNVVLWVFGAILVGSGIGAFQQTRRPRMEFVAGGAAGSVPPRSSVPSPPAVSTRGGAPGILPDGRIDLNSADERMLDTLDGIGPAKARAIVEYRSRYGPFRTVQDLDRVKGIGPAMLEKIVGKVGVETTATVGNSGKGPPVGNPPLAVTEARPVTPAAFAPTVFGGTPAAVAGRHPVQSAPGPPPRPAAATLPPVSGVTVNINTADMAQLMTLKYVGEARARAILQYRSAHGPFPTPESLDAVKGIGRQVMDANRGRIVVR